MSTVERGRRAAAVTRTPVEMPHWSDLTGAPGPFRGRAAAALLALAVPADARVLVAGPHDPALVAALPVPPERVTWLLRSRHDALAAAAATGVEVVCGGPEAPAGRAYDVIVALDGLDRVVSAEGRQLGWAQALETVAGLLAPGGTLLLGLANPLGVHELTALTPTPHEGADRHWHAPAVTDPDRPGSPDRLDTVLARDGLSVRRRWLGYPDPVAPALLLDPQAGAVQAADGEPSGAVSAALADAWAGEPGAPTLGDPHALAADALANGLGAAFAPLWLVLAVREPADLPELPELVAAEPAGPAAVTWTLRGGAREVVPPAPADVAAFGVGRDLSLLAGPVPAGPGFARVLRDACRRRDTPRVRRLLIAYADWLRGHADERGLVGGAYACTGLDGLVLTGDGPAVLDRSWFAGERPYPVVLARTLRRFAVDLLTRGAVHPWPDTLDADALTLVLTGAAGQRPDPDAVAQAVAFEADLRAARAGLDRTGRDELARRLAAVDAGTPPDVAAYQELLLAHRRLRTELEHARGVTARTDQQRRAAEDALRGARRTAAQLRGSASFRLGRALLAPARWARAAVRRLRRN
ncbi:class I SAM-dependent methyltransferase [Catellatospora sp. NPDC049609]|uniref:class I SAM-dependent methyltransferase n=1 Tax=Catellatospora sp. NPDC049609 TaxID=3155505 RepID=UPI003423FD8C